MTQLTKRYKDYTISQRKDSGWWNVFKKGNFFATVISEDEARRCIWMDIKNGEEVSDEMMGRLWMNTSHL